MCWNVRNFNIYIDLNLGTILWFLWSATVCFRF